MRRTLAVIVMIGLASGVEAQPSPNRQAREAAPAHFGPLPSIGLPLPTIGFPLPPIGLPLPPIGLPPAVDTYPRRRGDSPPRHAGTRHPRTRPKGHGRPAPAVIYVVPGYSWGYPEPTAAMASGVSVPGMSSAPAVEAPATGTLRLDVVPREGLQLRVDGYYVGTSDDFPGGLDLEPGPHRIELRAEGYHALTFDVRIAAGLSITYRETLTPEAASTDPPPASVAPPPVTPAPPTTIYFIPGCYLGNLPPKEVALPPGCDLGRLVIHKP